MTAQAGIKDKKMMKKTKILRSGYKIPKSIIELWFSSQLMKAQKNKCHVKCPTCKRVETKLNPFDLQKVKL